MEGGFVLLRAEGSHAILQHDSVVVTHVGIERCSLHTHIRTHPCENQRTDFLCLKPLCKRLTGKAAVPVFRDTEVRLLRFKAPANLCPPSPFLQVLLPHVQALPAGTHGSRSV